MRTPRNALVALLLAIHFWGCGTGSERFEATGSIVAVADEQRVLKIAHEEIPGFMPAMTMSFDVAPGILPGKLQRGDAVRFTIERGPRRLMIVHLELGGSHGTHGVTGVSDEDAPLAPRPAPPFRLIDQEGAPFDLVSLRGRAVLLDFIFTTCTGPCPILTMAHARLQRRIPPGLRDRVHFVSISVDPLNDTPAKLKRYARSHDAELETWSFLTGGEEEVDAVLRAYHVGQVRLPDATINHTVVTYLIDQEGNIMNHYLGLERAQDELMSDLLEIIS